MKQMNMFPEDTDYGKGPEKAPKGRWYVITRRRNTEALYLIEGNYEWREYDPLTSVPHAFTNATNARRVIIALGLTADVRQWPYGVLRPGRTS